MPISVQVGDSGNEKKTGGQVGGVRVKDISIYIGIDQHGKKLEISISKEKLRLSSYETKLERRGGNDVQRRDSGYFVQRVLKMKLLGRRTRGRPQRRFRDVMKEDMQKEIGVTGG